MTEHDPSEPAPLPSKSTLTEVKYSLPDLLAEIAAEKGSASFAMEKLDQAEIGKLFKTKKVVRVKPKT
jgi:hypothetical protein